MISEEAKRVKEALIEQGLETPIVESDMTPEQKYQRIKGF